MKAAVRDARSAAGIRRSWQLKAGSWKRSADV
jgi:hypothetical protein